MGGERSLLAFAVGNSRIQAGWIEDGKVLEVRRVPTRFDPDLGPLRSVWADRGQPGATIVAGVVPEVEDLLIEVIGPDGVDRIDGSRNAGLVNRCRNPEQVGIDRLLAARAAFERTGAETLVFDFGTAFTANLVVPPGEFLGGAIGPGLGLAARALGRGAALLPEIEATDGLPPVLGSSTEEALRAGIFWNLVGGVERIVAEVTRSRERRPRVVATGGDAARIASGTDAIEEVVEHLVLEGLWHVSREE